MHKWSLVGGGQAPSRPPPDGTRFGLITSARHSRSSSGHAGAMSTVININDVLDGHVRFSVDCVDRVLLNAYVPTLQTSGGVAYFMREHLGLPIPSPAVMEKIGNRFRREVRGFRRDRGHPDPAPQEARPLPLGRSQARPRLTHLERAEREGYFGVVAIVAAQLLPSSIVSTGLRRMSGSNPPSGIPGAGGNIWFRRGDTGSMIQFAGAMASSPSSRRV